ncbi:MAG: spermidine synthase family protein, partial [Planctomycetota bacterium]
AAGAYALSENYIYTREAFQAYLARLKPGGMLMMTRWFYMPPRQTLRLISAAREALLLEGVEDPDSCFFLARARLRSLILIKKEPFLPEETTKLLEGCRDREAQLIHVQGLEGFPEVDRFFTEKGRAEMAADYPYRVDAPTDDCPFLFEHTRWSRLFGAEQDWFMGSLGGLEVIFITLMALILLLGLGMAIMLLYDRLLLGKQEETPRKSARLPWTGRFLLAAAFLIVGLNYLTVEAVLLPKLVLPLGHPVYAMSLVLVSLLVFSGLGSIFSRRLPATGIWAAAACIAAAVSLPLLFQGAIEMFSDTLLHASLLFKMVLLWALIAVPGFLMGIPFPLAIRVFGERDETLVPRAFLWNGVGSALAAPLATGLAITVGFAQTLRIATAGYVLVGILLASAFAGIRIKK